MHTATQVQILDEAVWISYDTSALGKGMNSAILIQLCLSSYLTLVWQLVEKKENSELKPVKLSLKNWLCVGSCLCGGAG